MATPLLEKQETETPEAADFGMDPMPYHWTVAAFSKAGEAGVFGPNERLELIQGRIIKIMGQGSCHSTLASVIADMLRVAFMPGGAVREEKPVRLSPDSEPLPDIMVLKGKQTDYGEQQPGPDDVHLLVEVSVTTAEYDLGEKALMYAQAGIADYWVVLVKDNAVVVHREPSPEGYAEITRLTGNDMLSPLALPEAAWAVETLLGRSDA